MQVFYVNLERRVDRKERFVCINQGIADFQRFGAVDGQSLQTADLLRDGAIREPLQAYTTGALGCALSHKALWDGCVSLARVVTVAEDDAVFNKHFVPKATALLATLPADWDIVLWGWNFDSMLHVQIMEDTKQAVMHFDPRPLGGAVTAFQEKDYAVLPLPLLGAFGLVCYSLSPKGAQRFRDRCFPLRNEEIPVPGLGRNVPNFGLDVMMNKYYGTLKSYVSFPPLVWTDNDKSLSDVSRKA